MNKLKHNDKKSVISSEQFEGKDNKVYICSWCSCTLSKLIDHSGQNPSLYCSRCQMSFDPEYDNLRHESKITTQHEDIEPAITSIQTNMADEVEVNHTVPIRGGFAELQKKGLKIKDYRTTERQ
jgi:hypothetical protein